MSNTSEHETERDKPLPRPVGEDGIVQDEQDDSELDRIDGGLTDVGSGKSDERKIV